MNDTNCQSKAAGMESLLREARDWLDEEYRCLFDNCTWGGTEFTYDVFAPDAHDWFNADLLTEARQIVELIKKIDAVLNHGPGSTQH